MSAIEKWAGAITVEQLDTDPYPIHARMRREAPVCFVPAVGLWFVTRWADVEFAASHPELIDSSVTPSPLDRAMGGKSILVLDGEPQRKLRAMPDPSLRPRVVEASTPGLIESGQAALVASDPAAVVRDAVEEGLRWVSPIGTQTRQDGRPPAAAAIARRLPA